MSSDDPLTSSPSSTSLRAHVDAALDPMYERLFAALDLLLVHRTRRHRDTARILELHTMLETRIAELDRGDRSKRADGANVSVGGAWRWSS